MYFLTCASAVLPCPQGDQGVLSLAESLDPALLGITPETVAFVYGFGAMAVLSGWLVGYGVSVALTMIRKI